LFHARLNAIFNAFEADTVSKRCQNTN